jgi:hypothetical protein
MVEQHLPDHHSIFKGNGRIPRRHAPLRPKNLSSDETFDLPAP